MGDPTSPPSATPSTPRPGGLSLEETGPLWDGFRAGDPVRCPQDTGPLALSVDGASAYRLVCTWCGTASSWFETVPTGIQVRTVTVPAPPNEED
jgi:hypothetical protein